MQQILQVLLILHFYGLNPLVVFRPHKEDFIHYNFSELFLGRLGVFEIQV